MSDLDGEVLGAFFDDDETAPEYAIESLTMDREEIAQEGRCVGVGVGASWAGHGSTMQGDRVLDGRDGTGSDVGSVYLSLSREPAPRKGRRPFIVHYCNKRHSLWGHRLWNAAKYLVKRMDAGWIDVRGKTVLELGAGLGVPSIAAYHNGARLCVVTDYPDTELLDIIKLNVRENCGGGADSSVQAEEGTLRPGVAVVEPLLWGNADHIAQVMHHTGGIGFDLVILSDILFNHVCNDDLADTLAATLRQHRDAAGYCVFSHHRAHKQMEDYEFFDKCVARGLDYEKIDEEDYPLMFPEDRGPEEVRQPVKCYKIVRRYDAAGGALDAKSQFDVVIQGTGMVQAYVSAALSRSGFKVLHCDGRGYYGGLHYTPSLKEMRELLRPCAAVSAAGVCTPVVLVDRCLDGGPPGGDHDTALDPGASGAEGHSALAAPARGAAVDAHRFLVDLLPTSFMSHGATVRQLVESHMVRTMEFQNFSGLLFLSPRVPVALARAPSDGAGAALRVGHVSLTRADIFSTRAIGLLEKRRLMKFIKDVEALLAEQLHAQNASPADDMVMQEAAMAAAARHAVGFFVKKAEAQPDLTLSALLEQHYGISGAARDMVSLMGQLDRHPPAPLESALAEGGATAGGLLYSVQLVRQLLLSVGAYGGRTPFLVPLFGASEMPQHMCRISAMWGGTFILHRSVCRISVCRGNGRQCAVLSNGQCVPAKVIVAPKELVTARVSGLPVRHDDDWQATLEREKRRAEGDATAVLSGGQGWLLESEMQSAMREDIRLSRVVVVLRHPLVTWAHLQQAAEEAVRGDAVATQEVDSAAPPVVVALMRDCPSASPGGADTEAGVIQLIQHSSLSEQVPPGEAVIVHFTADAAEVPQARLEAFVREHFWLRTGAATRSAEDCGASPLGFPDDDVVFFSSFTLSALQAALAGQQVEAPYAVVDKPSETRHTHLFAVAERMKLQRATEEERRRLHNRLERDGATDTAPPGVFHSGVDANVVATATLPPEPELRCVIPVSTLRPGLLDDGQYMEEARVVYERVVDQLLGPGVDAQERAKKYVFLEKMAPM